jgi:hypothetical protein
MVMHEDGNGRGAAQRLALSLAWIVVVLLATGVGRLFVVCSGPHSGPRIELAHPSGDCSHGTETLAEGPDAGGCLSEGAAEEQDAEHGGGCVDRALELDPGTKPKAPSDTAVALDHFSTAPVYDGRPARDAAPPARVPAQPPSWPDPLTALRRCVVLLI